MVFMHIGMYIVNVDKIVYFESDGEYHTKIYMASDNEITVNLSMEEVKNELECAKFEDRERRKQSNSLDRQ